MPALPASTRARRSSLIGSEARGPDQPVRLSSVRLPLSQPISDAKVLTGRQSPMTEVMMLFAEVETTDRLQGLGISYSKRAGGPGQFAHAREVAPAADR